MNGTAPDWTTDLPPFPGQKGDFLLDSPHSAAMAELVDALDSGSSRGNLVEVRVLLAALSYGGVPLAPARYQRRSASILFLRASVIAVWASLLSIFAKASHRIGDPNTHAVLPQGLGKR